MLGRGGSDGGLVQGEKLASKIMILTIIIIIILLTHPASLLFVIVQKQDNPVVRGDIIIGIDKHFSLLNNFVFFDDFISFSSS